jgi:hypothetical protein
MLTELCEEIHNWFDRDQPKYVGEFSISSGVVYAEDGNPLEILPNQFFRVIGSVFNDGVHQAGDAADTFTDETFRGAVWLMAVPKAVLDLDKKITDWEKNYGAQASSPFASESLTASSYSYTKASSSGADAGAGWRNAFSADLKKWRKMRP